MCNFCFMLRRCKVTAFFSIMQESGHFFVIFLAYVRKKQYLCTCKWYNTFAAQIRITFARLWDGGAG